MAAMHSHHHQLVILILLGVAASVQAGCYRNGRVKPVRSENTLYLNHEEPPHVEKHKLPKQFNWCDLEGKNLCASSWNQHIPQYCGSCYVHGTLSMVQDRIKIGRGGVGQDVMLGRQTFLNCAPFHNMSGGCDGGDPIDIFHYMHKYGLPDESCYPYQATDYTKFAGNSECPADAYCRNCMPINGTDTCWAVETPIRYFLKAYGKVSSKHGVELGMMNEIYHRGPITCSIATPEWMIYEYRGGIYSLANDTDVDHDVEVVGWGEEDGTPYWHIRNSWGSYWGIQGFMKLPRGVNSLVIEGDDCWYAIPDHSMEDKVLNGDLQGSMYGLVKGKKQDSIQQA